MKKSIETTLIDGRPLLAARFEFVSVLGRGAAGAVYQVRDTKSGNKDVALKILLNNKSFDRKTYQRFLEEVRLCKTLKHPNLVEAYELIELDDGIACTMEYVDGSDLRIFVGEKSPDEEMIDTIFDQLLQALDVLHKNGIVHRDVKLENILINKEGVLKLADLGLAKVWEKKGITKTGIRLGTMQYLPPEYVQGGHLDTRSDLYACGIVLYELLTGKRRLGHMPGRKAVSHLIKTRFKVPEFEGIEISERYRYAVVKAMTPYPEKRFQSAMEMREIFVNSRVFRDSDLSIDESIKQLPGWKINIVKKNEKRKRNKDKSQRLFHTKLFVLVTLLVLSACVFFISSFGRKVRLGELSHGRYCGYANGITSLGSLDPIRVYLEPREILFGIASKKCKPIISSESPVVLTCHGQEFKLITKTSSSNKYTGVLENTATGDTHTYYLEECG